MFVCIFFLRIYRIKQENLRTRKKTRERASNNEEKIPIIKISIV